MKPLHATGTPVPWSRVIRDYRNALLPLGVILAVNVAVLVLVVLPLSARVAANQRRADAAARAEATAAMDFQQAEALRQGKTRATADLETFYKQVLPPDVATARRILQSKIQRLARAHNVKFEHGTSDTEAHDKATLEHFTYSMTLTGAYDDIRAFVYELETAPEFVVIDNVMLSEGSDASAPLALSVDLSTYYLASRARDGVQPRQTANGR